MLSVPDGASAGSRAAAASSRKKSSVEADGTALQAQHVTDLLNDVLIRCLFMPVLQAHASNQLVQIFTST